MNVAPLNVANLAVNQVPVVAVDNDGDANMAQVPVAVAVPAVAAIPVGQANVAVVPPVVALPIPAPQVANVVAPAPVVPAPAPANAPAPAPVAVVANAAAYQANLQALHAANQAAAGVAVAAGQAINAAIVPIRARFGTFVSAISTGNMRNGPTVAIASAARASSIEVPLKWSRIRMTNAMAAEWLADNEATRSSMSAAFAECHTRLIFAQLVMNAVVNAVDVARTAFMGENGMDIDDDNGGELVGFDPADTIELARDTAMNLPRNRMTAVVVGAARGLMTMSYQIQAHDLVQSERSGIDIIQLSYTVANGVRMSFVSEHVNPDLYTTAEFAFVSFVPLTEAEANFVSLVQMMAVAAPALAGLSLHQTDHHYLSNNQRRNLCVENQVCANADTELRALWQAEVTTCRDLLWHKSVHPILPAVLLSVASDPAIKEKMTHAKLGSACVALPIAEPEVHAAQSAKAVVHAISPLAVEAGHVVGVPKIKAALRTVELFPRQFAPGHDGLLTAALARYAAAAPYINAANNRNYTENDASIVKVPGIVDRASAIARALVPAMEASSLVIAWSMGFYKAQMEDAEISSSRTEGSLLRSYSARRAASNDSSIATQGKLAYEESKSNRRAQAAKGIRASYTYIQ